MVALICTLLASSAPRRLTSQSQPPATARWRSGTGGQRPVIVKRGSEIGRLRWPGVSFNQRLHASMGIKPRLQWRPKSNITAMDFYVGKSSIRTNRKRKSDNQGKEIATAQTQINKALVQAGFRVTHAIFS